MESLQRLAALPLVDNACASRANKDSWSYSVYCREVLGELEDLFSARRSLKIGAKSGGKARLTDFFSSLFQDFLLFLLIFACILVSRMDSQSSIL